MKCQILLLGKIKKVECLLLKIVLDALKAKFSFFLSQSSYLQLWQFKGPSVSITTPCTGIKGGGA